MSNSIKNHCILVKVSIGKQSAYVTDQDISDSVEKQYQTHGRLRSVKRLFKDCKEFKDVQAAYAAVYQHYVSRTLPWNEAYRVLPSKEFTKFVNKMDDMARDAQNKLDKFANNLSQHIADDLTKCGGLTKAEEYPTDSQLRDNFYVKWNFSSISDSNDFRVIEGLDEQEIETLVNKAKDSERSNLMAPVKESWNRLYKVTAHLRDRLQEYQGAEGERLHKSLVGNIQDCVSVLRTLNITNDSNLEAVMDELENNVLPDADIDRLKVLKTERDKTVQAVNAIMDKMAIFKDKE